MAGLTSYIEALLPPDRDRWNENIGDAVNVTYSFMNSLPDYYIGEEESNNFSALSSTQKTGVRNALAAWSAVSGLSFTEVSDEESGGQVRLGTCMLESGVAAHAYYPGPDDINGDVWLNNTDTDNLNLAAGSYGFHTLVHELGHALGLKHSGNYGDDEPPFLSTAEDTSKYTVMSYNDYSYYGNISPQTPMPYDIAAIQYLYGANEQTRSGDTMYGTEQASESSFKWTTNASFVMTVWDGGGEDTINASNQTRRSIIDLRPGYFSSIGRIEGADAVDNLAIAYDCTIENAIGGSGNDVLTGNDANNTLTANNGKDTLTGGIGDDTLNGGLSDDIISGNEDNDSMIGDIGADYLYGGQGNDLLQGMRGNDVLYGGKGDDTLQGGMGIDTLNGGTGEDMFRFLSLTHSTLDKLDTITDFSSGENDKIVFSGIGATSSEEQSDLQASLGTPATLQDALNRAAEINQTGNGVCILTFDSDTYIYREEIGSGNAYVSTDMVIKVSGKPGIFFETNILVE